MKSLIETARSFLGLSRAEAQNALGEAVQLEQGIAFSAQGETLQHIEVFRPCSQREYETQIYKKPHDFIR
ncbi:MAG: hypothetical protein WD492_05575 [Alkalispirochaeta sp.]